MRSGSWLGQTHHYSVAAVRLRAGGEFLTDEAGPLELFLPPTYPYGAQAAAQLGTLASSILLCLSTRSRRWRLVDGPHADLPSITLTNKNR
jgi:hypothetical protein